MALKSGETHIVQLEQQIYSEIETSDVGIFETPVRFQAAQMCAAWNTSEVEPNAHSGINRFNDGLRNSLMAELRNCMINNLPFVFVHVDADNLKQANGIAHWFGNFCIKRSAVNAAKVLDGIDEAKYRRIMVAIPSETAADDLLVAIFPINKEAESEITAALSGIDRTYKMKDPLCSEYLMSSSFGVITEENHDLNKLYQKTIKYLIEDESRLPRNFLQKLMEKLEKRAHFYKEVKSLLEFPNLKELLMLEEENEFEKRIADYEMDKRGDYAASKLKLRLTRYHERIKRFHGAERELEIDQKLKNGVLGFFPEIRLINHQLK